MSSELRLSFELESGSDFSSRKFSLSSSTFLWGLRVGDVGVRGELLVGERVVGGGGGGLIGSKGSFGLVVLARETLFTPCSMDFDFTWPSGFCQLQNSVPKKKLQGGEIQEKLFC